MKTLNNLKEAQKAYSEVLDLLRKYKDILVFNVDTLEEKAKNHLFGLELVHKYGLNLDPKSVHSLTLNHYIKPYISIGIYKNLEHTDLAGKYVVLFSPAAYMFGSDYPLEVFKLFLVELKEYKPDYIDVANLKYYWKLENAKDVFNNFDEMVNKYHTMAKSAARKRKLETLKREIEELLDEEDI